MTAMMIHETTERISRERPQPLNAAQQSLLAWAMQNHEEYMPAADDVFFTGSIWEFRDMINRDATLPYTEEDIRRNHDMFIVAPMGIIGIVF